MQLYSTKHASPKVNLEEAIFRGLPPDNGLYMPENIPVLPKEFWENSEKMSFQEIAIEICNALFSDEIPREDIKEIIASSMTFDAPLRKLDDKLFCLELFHGPSMAFKDFGARFMAALMSYYLKKSNKKINILVATSGDTGGAVAQGFYDKENITVTILYPKGKVSEIQEKQLTTLGKNIQAFEIEGTFDDCQKLVKRAFLDEDLKGLNLASANSINIARLIPQSFYYAYAYSRLKMPIVFSVPSGNLGDLCAGVLAYRMGMPVAGFIAASNENKVIPDYLNKGEFNPISPSIATISNAMDVGNPSNFPRLKELFNNDYEKLTQMVKGFYYTDEQTKVSIKEVASKYNYVTCPHSAIGYQGAVDANFKDVTNVFLSTAHYAKFLDVMEPLLGNNLEIPEKLQSLLSLKKVATECSTEFEDFKMLIVKNLG